METCQIGGSYKMRGVVNQLEKAKEKWKKNGNKTPYLVTLSAGEKVSLSDNLT